MGGAGYTRKGGLYTEIIQRHTFLVISPIVIPIQ
jgi:hypothetical protein